MTKNQAATQRPIQEVITDDKGSFVIEQTTDQAGTFRKRKIDIIEQWAKKGIDRGGIEQRDHTAAVMFGVDFDKARMSPRYSAMKFSSVGGDGQGFESDKVIDAQKRVNNALAAVGKLGSHILCAIIGEGKTLKEYAADKSWLGKSNNRDVVAGQLKAILPILADHYRI